MTERPGLSPALPCSRRGFLREAGAAMAGCLALTGCFNRRKQLPESVSLPGRHSVVSDQFVILSNFHLADDHPLVDELKTLRRQVNETLELEPGGEQVVVYLFENEQEYWSYLVSTWPMLPYRRAYFFDHGFELEVYTFWSDRISEDLRHEFTHGLLHAGLNSIPLWLDEGLAEYFEVSSQKPGTVRPATAARLTRALGNGWHPSLERLEKMSDVTLMTQDDYEESWAWVHFLMHHTPDTKATLLSYLHDLRRSSTPGRLSTRLFPTGLASNERFTVYIASLNTFATTSLDRP